MPRTTITTAAGRGQAFLAEAAVTFIWSALPARTEWRYCEASYKVIALDAGHVCQNLYLACEAIGAGGEGGLTFAREYHCTPMHHCGQFLHQRQK